MRTHGRFAQFAPSIDFERFHRVVAADALVAARLDTGYSARIDNHGLLDLVFARDGEIAVVPYLVVQGMQLFIREDSPFVWPAWLPPVRRERAREIEDAIEPWLRSLVIGRYTGGEHFRRFGGSEAIASTLEAARAYGFTGAAPTERVLTALAPYVYALRFARQRRVAVRDPLGANGTAVLARTANVVADLGDAQRARAAREWFGLDVFREIPSGEFDVAIGAREALAGAPVRVVLDAPGEAGERPLSVALPVPVSIMVSFDPNDSEVVRSFAAASPAPPLRPSSVVEMPIVGGSSGRIGLVVRDDYRTADDADTDAAWALAERLSEQGFSAELVGGSHVRPSSYDLLHVFGHRCAAALEGSIARAGGTSVPIVVTPYLDDPKNESLWGAAVHMDALSNAPDEAMRELYVRAIEDRLLVAPKVAPIGTPAIGDEVRALFARARAAIVSGEEEEKRLRELFGFQGVVRTAPALLAAEVQTGGERIGPLVGLDDFVFMHAPLDPRCNQYLVARVCAAEGLPLLMTGPVGNTEFYSEVCAVLGDTGMWIPSDAVSPAELAALYRRARVFVDASWSASGLYRLARAAAGGAALVAPASGFARGVWPGLVQLCDPGSSTGIATAIRTAWQRSANLGPALAARIEQQHQPFPVLKAVLAAYQHAAAATHS